MCIRDRYDLFPGVYLMYNDFHMEGYDSAFHTTEDMLCIDYCRQGRMEYPAGPDAYSYVEAGDLKLDRRLEHQGHFTFPLSHYHGITIGFTLPLAVQSLKEWVREFPVDLARLQEKFCAGRHPRVIHGAPSVDPVSYTHLDVYKRQASTRPTRKRSTLSCAAMASMSRPLPRALIPCPLKT